MSNIISYGLALPQYRISDDVLAGGKSRFNRKRTVCYTDEDILTLAFEAAHSCMDTVKSTLPDAVFFATTNPVFEGRYHATQIADWLGLSQNIQALDFCASTRSGTDALILANQLIASGLINAALVIAVNAHFAAIGNEPKDHQGHGACAILLGTDKGFATINFSKSISSGFADTFQYKGYPVSYDSRFGKDAGLKKDFALALKLWSEQLNEDATESFRILINASGAKVLKGQLKKAGVSDQLENDWLIAESGHLGGAHALFRLIDSLKNPNTKYALFDACNGMNILQYIVHEGKAFDWENYFSNSIDIRSYQDYLKLRKAAATGKNVAVKDMFSSEMISEREKESLIYLEALRCNHCHSVYYLKTMRCKKCHGEDFEKVKLSREGEVYTYTSEHYFPVSFPPVLMLVLNLDSGGRMTVQQTDDMYAVNQNIIAKRGKLVLRKMNEHDNKPNYFWKCKIKTTKNK